MGETMELTFKVRRSGYWACVEYPGITLRRMGRTKSKSFGWALFVDMLETGDRHLSKALAEQAANEFVTARETAKAYRPVLDEHDPLCTERCCIPPVPVVAPQLNRATIAERGRVPAALMSFDMVTAAVDAAVGALKSAVEVAATQAVRGTPEETDAELLDRIVRRAKYDALRAMRRALTGWAEGARDAHEAGEHRDDVARCCLRFTPKDIARMIDDAAREAGTHSPYESDEL